MEIQQLTQNADRYKVVESNAPFISMMAGSRANSPKNWIISASKDVKPLVLSEGTPFEFIPLLDVEGIVVKILGSYLISPVTLRKIKDNNNPHYSVIQNGEVNKIPMGKTIPIIEINTEALGTLGESRDASNRFAAVKSVDYGYETEKVSGIPKGLLEQINYTLKEKGTRPADTFSIWDLGLTGDYSIEQLKVQTAQDDGSLDKAKLDAFTTGTSERLGILREDFNSIKEIFYNGNVPLKATNSFSFTRIANVEDMDDEKKRGEKKVVIKTYKKIGSEDTPSAKTQAELAKIAEGAAKAIEESEKKLQGELDARNKTYDEIIAKWNAYGFTPTEKDSLKNPKGGTKKVSGGLFKKAKTVQQSILNVIKGNKEVNINIEWLPTVLDKAKIVGIEYPKNGIFANTANNRKAKEKYNEYYGAGKKKEEYDNLNKDRKAELLSLAEQIEEIEQQKGTTL
jgi:hypothetical protein